LGSSVPRVCSLFSPLNFRHLGLDAHREKPVFFESMVSNSLGGFETPLVRSLGHSGTFFLLVFPLKLWRMLELAPALPPLDLTPVVALDVWHLSFFLFSSLVFVVRRLYSPRLASATYMS